MVSEGSSTWQEMIAYAREAVWNENEELDLGELNFLLGLALRDGILDEAEKGVFREVFHKIEESHVPPHVWQRIEAIRKAHDI